MEEKPSDPTPSSEAHSDAPLTIAEPVEAEVPAPVAEDEAEFAKEPPAVHFSYAVDNSSHAHDAATWHRHLFFIVFINLGFRDSRMNDEPTAPFRWPVPVFNVFAVMKDVMRERLLDAQSLDLSRSNSIRKSEEVDMAVCFRLLAHD